MFQCPMCPRQLKSRSGLSGHLQFKHATKLQALKAAPEQLGPAPGKALEAAPDVTLLYQLLDPIECTVYMIDHDVSRLASAVEMQEVILWETDTKVDLLRVEIKSQSEEHQKGMELVKQEMAKLITDVDVLARGIVQVSDKIEKLMSDRHPPGFCQEMDCDCHAQKENLRTETKKLIDNQFILEKLKRLGMADDL